MGIANTTVVTSNTVQAFIDDDISVQANGDRAAVSVPSKAIVSDEFSRQNQLGVIVVAVSNDTLTNVAAGAAISGSGNSLAGSASVTSINDTTQAWIGDRTRINKTPDLVTVGANENVGQNVVVLAAERTQLDGVAGALGISFSKGGFGAGADVAIVTKNTQASIGANADVEAAGDVLVDAYSFEDVVSVAASIGVGKSVGVAFGVGVSKYNLTTQATIGNSAAIEAYGSVLVNAEDEFEYELGTGSGAFGLSTGAVGGSFNVPIVIKTTTATISDSAVINAYAQRNGYSVHSGDFVAFSGDTSQSGQLGQADLDYSNLPTDGDRSYFEDRKATPAVISSFQGVAVTSVSGTAMELYGVGAAGSTGSALQIAFGFTHLDETTTASIGAGAAINPNTSGADSDQAVHVGAGNDLFMRTVVGAVAGAGKAAGAPAADIIRIAMDTHAFINDNAQVNATDDVTVLAYAEEDIIGVSVAVAGSLGGSFAGAGAAVAVDLTNTTYAYVGDGATVTSDGNVQVYAEDRTDADVVAGGVGLAIASGGGVGASIGVSLLAKDTDAWIGASTIDALGNQGTFAIFNGQDDNGNAKVVNVRGVGVSAFALEDLFVLSVAGAGGVVTGIAGAVNWQKIDSDTSAKIYDGANINQSSSNATAAHAQQDVYVVALNKLATTGIAGALGATAGIGIGAGIDVGTVDNATVATLGGDVTARRDVRVAATSDREIKSIGAAASIGAGGLAGGVSSWVISGTVDGNYSVGGVAANALEGQDQNGGTGQLANTSTESTLNASTNVDSGYGGQEARADNTGTVANVAGDVLSFLSNFSNRLTTSHFSETRAEILPSANVVAGEDVEVEAREDNDIDLAGGSVTFSGAGAGAGVSLLTMSAPVVASIGGNATVDAAGRVDVRATSDESATAYGIAGIGTLVGGAAAFARLQNNSLQSASIKPNALITGASSVDVIANHRADLLTKSGSGGLGIGVIGVSGALTVSSGRVEAFVDGATIGQADNKVGAVNVRATSVIQNNPDDGRSAHAVGVAGGAVTVVGVSATSTVNPEVVGALGAGTQVHSSGAVSVIGEANLDTNAVSTNINVGALTFGASFATSTLEPTVVSEVGDGVVVEGASVDVLALNNFDQTGLPRDNRARTYALAGAGAAIAVIGSSATSEAKGSAVATVGTGASLSATTTDLSVQALSSNDAYAEGDGVALTFFGNGDAMGSSVVDTLTSVVIANDAVLAAHNSLTIQARSRDDADGWGDAGDRGVIPFSHGTGNIDVTNQTDVFVGSRVDLSARNALTVEATVDHRTEAKGSSDVGAFGLSLGSNILTETTSNVTTNVDVDVYDATLQGNTVTVRSRMNSLAARADSDSVAPYEFGADTDAFSHLTSSTSTDVNLLGTTIVGVSSVSLESSHLSVSTKSDAKADANAIGGDTDVDAQNVTTIHSDLSTDAATAITTPSLIVRAEIPAAIIQENPEQIKALLDGGTASAAAPSVTIDRNIQFNASVNVAGSGPVLTIDANGVASTQTGGVTFTDNGSTIIVDPIVNAGQLQGNVAFELPNAVGTRRLGGSANINRQQAFIQVHITNESARDLQLGFIDVLNENGTVQVTRTSGINDTLVVNQTTSIGDTDVEIDNAQSVILAGKLDNAHGTTSITAESGNITRNTSGVEIVTNSLNLNAPAGTIGSGTATLDRLAVSSTTSTTLEANASGNIFLRQSLGNVQVQALHSSAGSVDIFAVGAILDGSGENVSADISGNTIDLTSHSSSIGTAANPLEVDVSSTAKALSAFARTGVYLTEIAGAVSVRQLNASNGDIVFTQIDAPGNLESFELPNDSYLSAVNGSITLVLADNVSLDSGSGIISNNLVTILVDQEVVANDAGATVSIDTQFLNGATWTLTTGNDADDLRIKGLNRPGVVSTGLGNDVIEVSSDAQRLNLVAANLRFNAGGDWDTLLLNASGASSEGVSGTLGASPAAGYTERVSGFELQSVIDYTAFEVVTLQLGAGPDTAQILSVGDDMAISAFGGEGADQFIVGDGINGLSNIQGRLNLDGGEAADQLLINDLANAVCTVGLLTERSLTGLGMGSASEGVRYDAFESLKLDLASESAGEYQLAITSLAVPTQVKLGDGNDHVTVGDNLFRIAADLLIDAGADSGLGDKISISSSLSTDLQLGQETVNATDMAGTIRLLNFESQAVNLSNAPDTVTVTDTGSPLALDMGEGADRAIVINASHATTIDLGSDSDRDRVAIHNASANIEILGNSAAADSLLVDTSAAVSPSNVQVTDGASPQSVIVAGATARHDHRPESSRFVCATRTGQ